MPDTGPRAPARTLVAVRAVVTSDADAAEQCRTDVGETLRHQFAVRR